MGVSRNSKYHIKLPVGGGQGVVVGVLGGEGVQATPQMLTLSVH